MPESQAHGKKWEESISTGPFRVSKEHYKLIKHTARYDLPGELNHLDNGVNIQIKTTGRDTVDLGDALRMFDNVKEGQPKLHMVVLKHKQKDPTTKKLESVTEADLTNSGKLLFNGVTREQVENLDKTAKAVGKVRPDVSPEQRRYQIDTAYAMRDELHKISGCFRFHLMFYTNKPSRVQGQLDFKQFKREHPERIIAESQTGEFRGGTITEEIVSPPRKRNKKVVSIENVPSTTPSESD